MIFVRDKKALSFLGLNVISMKTQALDAQVNHINVMYDNHVNKSICQPCNRKDKTLTGMINTCKKYMEWLILKNLKIHHPDWTTLQYIMHLLWNASSYYAKQMMLTKLAMALELSAIRNFKCCYQGREIIPIINCGYFVTWQTVSVFLPREWPMSKSWTVLPICKAVWANNIPCDNLVELLVQTVKVPTQHSHALEKLHLLSKSKMKSRTIFKIEWSRMRQKIKRKESPPVSKLLDIFPMVSELVSIFDIVPGHEYISFTGFKDVFLNIKYQMANKQQRLSYETL